MRILVNEKELYRMTLAAIKFEKLKAKIERAPKDFSEGY